MARSFSGECVLADYWHCPCVASVRPNRDSAFPPLGRWSQTILPAPGRWRRSGSATQDPEACGSGAEDAEAATDAGGVDAGADAEAGTSWPVPFPEPSSRALTKPLGATKVLPSPPPSKLLTAPTVFSPSRSRERSHLSPPSSTKSAANATSLIPTYLLRRGLLLGDPASTDSGAILGSISVSGYPAASAKARGVPPASAAGPR